MKQHVLCVISCLALLFVGFASGVYVHRAWTDTRPRVLVYSDFDVETHGYYDGVDGRDLDAFRENEYWKHMPKHLRLLYLEHYGRGTKVRKLKEQNP